MLAWVFERQNREVRFVTRFFAKRREAVVKITWLDGIKPGASVRPGTELATLTWSNGQRQRLRAPAGCVGKIAAVNRRIGYEGLDKYPSGWGLRLHLLRANPASVRRRDGLKRRERGGRGSRHR